MSEWVEPVVKWAAIFVGLVLFFVAIWRLILSQAISRDDLKESEKALNLQEKARLAHEREDEKNRDL